MFERAEVAMLAKEAGAKRGVISAAQITFLF